MISEELQLKIEAPQNQAELAKVSYKAIKTVSSYLDNIT